MIEIVENKLPFIVGKTYLLICEFRNTNKIYDNAEFIKETSDGWLLFFQSGITSL